MLMTELLLARSRNEKQRILSMPWTDHEQEEIQELLDDLTAIENELNRRIEALNRGQRAIKKFREEARRQGI